MLSDRCEGALPPGSFGAVSGMTAFRGWLPIADIRRKDELKGVMGSFAKMTARLPTNCLSHALAFRMPSWRNADTRGSRTSRRKGFVVLIAVARRGAILNLSDRLADSAQVTSSSQDYDVLPLKDFPGLLPGRSPGIRLRSGNGWRRDQESRRWQDRLFPRLCQRSHSVRPREYFFRRALLKIGHIFSGVRPIPLVRSELFRVLAVDELHPGPTRIVCVRRADGPKS